MLNGTKINGFILGAVGLLVFALLINVVISIYEPQAVANAVAATESTTFTINGHIYNVTGNGQSAASAVQAVHDNFNLTRTIANTILGIVFLVLVILGAVSFFKGNKN